MGSTLAGEGNLLCVLQIQQQGLVSKQAKRLVEIAQAPGQ
jgi:hypothetical protein